MVTPTAKPRTTISQIPPTNQGESDSGPYSVLLSPEEAAALAHIFDLMRSIAERARKGASA